MDKNEEGPTTTMDEDFEMALDALAVLGDDFGDGLDDKHLHDHGLGLTLESLTSPKNDRSRLRGDDRPSKRDSNAGATTPPNTMYPLAATPINPVKLEHEASTSFRALSTDFASPFTFGDPRNRTSESRVVPQLEATAEFAISKKLTDRDCALARPLIEGQRCVLGIEYPMEGIRPVGCFGAAKESNTKGLFLTEWEMPWTRGSVVDRSVPTEHRIFDLQWIIPGEVIVYASEKDIQVCHWNGKRSPIVDLLPFRNGDDGKSLGHVDVRQLAVHENRLATGDGNGDLSIYTLSEARTKPVFVQSFGDTPVGSVSWSPFRAEMIVYTLDNGTLGIMDVRMGRRPAVILSQNCSEDRTNRLFAHCELSDTNMILGYEGGRLGSLDMRLITNERLVAFPTFKDKYVHAIGEIIRPSGSASRIAVCGVGGFSIWDFSDASRPIPLSGAQPLERRPSILEMCKYKTSGCFLPSEPTTFAMTDSTGYLSFYDLSRL